MHDDAIVGVVFQQRTEHYAGMVYVIVVGTTADMQSRFQSRLGHSFVIYGAR